MTKDKPLTIILPSYKDIRILASIKSIRALDDQELTRILVIDGASGSDFCDRVRRLLNDDDLLISEPDNGIFDALNKGLDIVTTPYIGWLGSDDFFSGEVKASEIIESLKTFDLYVGDLVIFSGSKIKRRTYALFSRSQLAVKMGLHNPHYATFGRASILQRHRFCTTNKAADIGYFVKVFSHDVNVKTTNKVITYQAEGGFSNSSLKKVWEVNQHAFESYGYLWPLSIVLKISLKIVSAVRYRFWPKFLPESVSQAYLRTNPEEL